MSFYMSFFMSFYMSFYMSFLICMHMFNLRIYWIFNILLYQYVEYKDFNSIQLWSSFLDIFIFYFLIFSFPYFLMFRPFRRICQKLSPYWATSVMPDSHSHQNSENWNHTDLIWSLKWDMKCLGFSPPLSLGFSLMLSQLIGTNWNNRFPNFEVLTRCWTHFGQQFRLSTKGIPSQSYQFIILFLISYKLFLINWKVRFYPHSTSHIIVLV